MSNSLILISRDGSERAICTGLCGKLAHANRKAKGRWFCPDCAERIISHAISRFRRCRGAGRMGPLNVPEELMPELDRRWYKLQWARKA